jgi:hypothetical protein
MNGPLLEFIVSMGSDAACLSDAARAWLLIRKHFDEFQSTDLSRLSCCPATDIALLQTHAIKRFGDGMKDVLCLALLLDCRPKMRAFVKAEGLIGAGSTLGNTDTIEAAKRATMHIAEGITWEGKTSHQVGLALCKALLVFLEVCSSQWQLSWCKCLGFFVLAEPVSPK